MNSKTWDRIKYWKRKYDRTPNGWAVSLMIGKSIMQGKRKMHKEKKSYLPGIFKLVGIIISGR